jgi:hypothetical protein
MTVCKMTHKLGYELQSSLLASAKDGALLASRPRIW